MGGSSDQVVGYKYYAGLQVAIGNRIEQLLGIRPDNREWILPNDAEISPNQDHENLLIHKPNLFGGDKLEGGWSGMINLHIGLPNPLQDSYLAAQDSEIVSAFPNLSYLVYHGADIAIDTETGEVYWVANQDKGFHLVSMSGMLKEVLYWVKRTQIKNDGSEQWYRQRDDDVVVCEMQSWIEIPKYPEETEQYIGPPIGGIESRWVYTSGCSLSSSEPATATQDKTWYHNQTTVPYNTIEAPFPKGQAIDGPAGSGPSAGCSSITSSSEGRKYGRYRVTVSNGAVDGNVCYSFNVQVPELCEIGEHLKWLWFSDPDSVWFRYSRNSNTNVTFIIVCPPGYTLDMEFYCKSADHPTRPDTNYWYQYSYSFSAWYILQMAGTYSGGVLAQGIDINPIHKIREILTDYTAMNKPESDVNDTNFMAAADRIWDENLGVSWAITEKSCKEAIDELLYHIEAGIRVNRQTGKYEIILFRDDLLDLGTAQSFNESNIKSFNPEISTSEDLTNVLNVKFYDRENIKDSSFNVYENGNIRTNDQEITDDVNFPYFMNRRNAELVANWKLKQLSTPAWKGSFTTGKYDARKLNRYDVIKLSWANLGIINLPVRVMKISLGDGIDNTVSIDFIEVVPYSSINYQPINVDPPTSVILPPQPNNSIAFEAPYFEVVQLFGQTQVDVELANNPDIGYLAVATKKPQNNSLNALLNIDDVNVGTVNYCPFAELDQNIGYLDTSFALKNVDSIASASVGTAFMLNDEIMVYESYDSDTKIITVKRGALDTVPHLHSIDDNLFFYDQYPSYSTTQYVDSEIVEAKVLTTTPSGIQSIGDATALPVEFDARMIRPYPPANVKINDEYYPIAIETDLIVAWVDRNRVQQTGGAILGWIDGGVTIESGTSTMLTIKEFDVDDLLVATHNIDATGPNTYTLAISTMQAETRSIEVTAKTVRDGYECLQPFEYIVELSEFFSAPYDLTVEYKND
jgi:hypothetical protein